MNARSEMNSAEKQTPDILLIDKPAGITSFDCIRVLRKALGVKKIGHAGTLDPLASGLLIVGVGEGTKKLDTLLTDTSKEYEVGVLLGMRTDTGDLEGEVAETGNIPPEVDEDRIKDTFVDMCDTLTLPVPKYSAIKVDGKPLYKYAREGKEVSIPERDMQIHDITLSDITSHEKGLFVDVTMHVASGVYVRSVAEEIGRRLGLPAAPAAQAGVPATVASLRRTKIGEYNVDNATPLSAYE